MYQHYYIPSETTPMSRIIVNILFLSTWTPAWLASIIKWSAGDAASFIPSFILTVIAIILACIRARMYYHDSRAKRIANRIAEEEFKIKYPGAKNL